MKKNPRDDPSSSTGFEKIIDEIVNTIKSILSIINLDCKETLIKDIVLESIIHAWHNGVNYIGYCIEGNNNIKFCVVEHIVWTKDLYHTIRLKDFFAIIIPEDKPLTKELLDIINRSKQIIKAETTVTMLLNTISKEVLSFLKQILSNISCTNIFYTFLDTFNTMYEDIEDT